MRAAEAANSSIKDAYDTAARRYEAIQALTQFEAQKKAADDDLLWALLAEDEAKLAGTIATATAATAKRDRLRDAIPTLQARLGEAESKHGDAEAGLVAAQASLQGLESQMDAKLSVRARAGRPRGREWAPASQRASQPASQPAS